MAAQRKDRYAGLISDKALADIKDSINRSVNAVKRRLEQNDGGEKQSNSPMLFRECLNLALKEKKTHYIVPELIARIGDAPVDNTFVGVVRNWFNEKSNMENAYRYSATLNSYILFIVKILKYCFESNIGNIDKSLIKAIKDLQLKSPALLSAEHKDLIFAHVQNELPALIPILEKAFSVTDLYL